VKMGLVLTYLQGGLLISFPITDQGVGGVSNVVGHGIGGVVLHLVHSLIWLSFKKGVLGESFVFNCNNMRSPCEHNNSY